MEYRYLGKSGLQVSVLGIGGNVFGRNVDEAGTAAVIHRALDIGVNFIDTSDTYTQGRSEELIGRAVKDRRHEAILATKGVGAMGEGPNDRQASRYHLMNAVHDSLRRFGTDYIDLYQPHSWDHTTPLDETLRTLDDLVRQGKIRYIGSSNYKGWQIAEAAWLAKTNHWTPSVSEQGEYSLLERGIEREVVPACEAYGVGVLPYYPLAGGFLTGKYVRGEERPPDSRGAYFAANPRASGRDRVQFVDRWENERYWSVLDRLEGFAAKHERPMAELAIAWLAAQPLVSSIIAGASRPEQVQENAKALEWKLTPDELKELDEITSA